MKIGKLEKHDNTTHMPNVKYDLRSALAPFVHKFQTESNKYIYDINSGEILRVDDAVWDIIGEVGDLCRQKIIQKYGFKYQASIITTAYEQIAKKRKQKKGLFSIHPKVVFAYIDKYEDIELQLKKKRMQLILNITEECNFKCSYCRYATKTSTFASNRMMDWEIARLAIDDFFEHCDYEDNCKSILHKPSIRFHGGEPLLNYKLIKKIVGYLRSKNKDVWLLVTTNGSLLTEPIAKYLVSEGFNITVSLDGPEHLHNKYRHGKNGTKTWKQVIDNISRLVDRYYLELKKNGGNININTVLSEQESALEYEAFLSKNDIFKNMHVNVSLPLSQREMYSAVVGENNSSKGLNELHSKYLYNLNRNHIAFDSNEFAIQRGLFEEYYYRIHKRNRLCKKFQTSFDTPVYRFPSSMCIAGLRRYFVTVDGDYYPCERFPINTDLKIGDVYSGINPVKVYKLIKNFFDCNRAECERCWCLGICQVGCYINMPENKVLDSKTKNSMCIKYRKHMNEILINYCTVLEQNPYAFDYIESQIRA